MRSRRAKVVPRTARGWTNPTASGRACRAFRGRMWFVGVSGGKVAFSDPGPPDRYTLGVDRGSLDYTAEVTYTNTVGGLEKRGETAGFKSVTVHWTEFGRWDGVDDPYNTDGDCLAEK